MKTSSQIVKRFPIIVPQLTRLANGYHGWLRVGTGLSLLEGMIELERRGAEIDIREWLCASARI